EMQYTYGNPWVIPFMGSKKSAMAPVRIKSRLQHVHTEVTPNGASPQFCPPPPTHVHEVPSPVLALTGFPLRRSQPLAGRATIQQQLEAHPLHVTEAPLLYPPPQGPFWGLDAISPQLLAQMMPRIGPGLGPDPGEPRPSSCSAPIPIWPSAQMAEALPTAARTNARI
ncbi:hypothetical protein B0H19DRAFT_1106157, partial [Mycena capillaripes]